MAFQFQPLVFGVIVVVALGTIIYRAFNSQNTPHGQGRGSYQASEEPYYDFDEASTTYSGGSCEDEDRERSRSRRNKDRCAICLSALKEGLRRLRCGHEFHSHCIEFWLNQNKTCPCCRTPQ